jgi:ABC-type bacteriocin/lantibiotic exporter with double-glycine peptidase domain
MKLELMIPQICGRRSNAARAAELALMAVATLSLGCASYSGTASTVQPSAVSQDGQWIMVPHFPLVLQDTTHDCGAAALSSVMRFWGYPVSSRAIEESLGRKDARLSAGDIETYARRAGLSSYVFFGTMKDVVHELRAGRPVIVGLGKKYEEGKAVSHYEVVVGYEPKKKLVLLLDPGRGWQTDSLDGFAKEWALSKAVTIVAFLPEPDHRVSQE